MPSGGAGGSFEGSVPECEPSTECTALCEVLGGDVLCGLGNARECPCVCERQLAGACFRELRDLLECGGQAPSVDCEHTGRALSGCEPESLELELCEVRAQEQSCALLLPECRPYCEAATFAYCGDGPSSVSDCLCGCELTLDGPCRPEFDAFLSCTAGAPEFQCDADDRLQSVGCADEWAALDACQGLAAPDAGADPPSRDVMP